MKIVKCGCDGNLGNKCAAEYQNMNYGPGMRVCNPLAEAKKFRCTVCSKEHNFNSEDKK